MNRRSLRSSYSDYSTRSADYANRRDFDQTLVRSERDRRDREERSSSQRGRSGGKRVPPEQTHAENYYYRKQMEAKTPMAIVLQDGETILGNIEWYDKACLKIHRNGEPNLLVFKHSIKYLYKQEKKVEAAAEEDYAEVDEETEAAETEEYEEDVEQDDSSDEEQDDDES